MFRVIPAPGFLVDTQCLGSTLVYVQPSVISMCRDHFGFIVVVLGLRHIRVVAHPHSHFLSRLPHRFFLAATSSYVLLLFEIMSGPLTAAGDAALEGLLACDDAPNAGPTCNVVDSVRFCVRKLFRIAHRVCSIRNRAGAVRA